MSLDSKQIPIIAIVGPTASGKTRLSIDIALKFSGDIISADSMQIYKELDICTAKPSKVQLNTVKHYLINEVSVKESFNVAEYVKRAHFYARNIDHGGKIPILVGGTGLYIDSFLKNISFEKNTSRTDIREKLYHQYNENKETVYKHLLKIDPESARNIHPNDTKRIIRALEFFYCYGYPISDQVERSKRAFSPYKVKILGLNFRNRDVLYERINQRVDEMFNNGLIEEAKNIYAIIGDTARAAIGFKEVLPYIRGECSMDEAIENLKRGTRNYAKRQITWFKKYKNIYWLYVDDYDSFDKLLLEAERIITRGCYGEFI